jgi:tRNA(Ile)-lysidine synthase
MSWFHHASRRRKWLAGVSGGADSVALLHKLHEAGFARVVVCHVNHGLRGAESDGDERFVRSLAKRLGYACEVERVDVRGRMAERRESMETAARGARWEFFARMARKHRCRSVVLGHHADDQAETVLWNLLRGSHRLRGMEEEREVEVEGVRLVLVRPMLDERHSDLVEWLKGRRLKWREDSSNDEPVAVRNRLRNEVFPLLGGITGRDPVAALNRAARDTAEADAWAEECLAAHRVMDPQGRIHIRAFSGLPDFLRRRAMADFLRNAGVGSISRALLEAALDLADVSGPASVNLPGGSRLRRSAGRIWFDR